MYLRNVSDPAQFNTVQITKSNINLEWEAMRTFLDLFIQSSIVAYTYEDYALISLLFSITTE
jgi:hypothetical protein